MKLKTSTILIVLVWCIFMGITVGSIGLGAAFPSVNLIAKPFVCPNGEMELSTQRYQPTPVESVTTITWYCVNPRTGAKAELGIFPMSLYAGTIYGLLLFAVVFVFMLISARRRASVSPLDDDYRRGSLPSYADRSSERTARIENRLVELKRLRDSNLISEEEYRKKRAEILEDL